MIALARRCAGETIVGSTSAECEAYLRSEIARWGKVIEDAGVTAE